MSVNRRTVLALLLAPLATSPRAAEPIDQLLARAQPPPGVVFEVVAAREAFLQGALPRVRADIERLRGRFPALAVAVVTHGAEQFSLLAGKREAYRQVHDLTRALVAASVDVHVCGTHAGWRGLAPEDFPDYVDVSASGPAQINDYVALGYVLVRVD